MEKVSGMINTITKTGKASLISSQFTFLKLLKNAAATKIKAGAVAKLGIDAKNGSKKRQDRNNTPTVTAVRPVLPPALRPAALSRYVVMLEVPSKLPKILADVSASTAFSKFIMVPSGLRNLAGSAMAVSVPVVSKKSTKNMTNTTDKNPADAIAEKSNENAAVANGGMLAMPPISANPIDQPIALITRMDNKIAPVSPR